MEIKFASETIAKLCLEEKFAIRQLGKACANRLADRLGEMVATACVFDLVNGRPEQLTRDLRGSFSLRLHGGFRIVFEPDPPHDLRGDKLDEFTKQRPLHYGTLTRNIVYERLAPGVLRELEAKNPRMESGHRKSKHHQWLTREIGHPKLREHITRIVTVMQLASTYDVFIKNLDVVAPRVGDTLTMPFMAQS